MKRIYYILLVLLCSSCVKGQPEVRVNTPGQPPTVGINTPGQPSTITVNNDTVELYILAGQSNVGRARVSEMTGPEAALYAGLISHAKILNPYLSDTDLYPLEVGINTMLDDAVNSDEFGCEASLFNTLPPKTRYLLKYGDGNTSMQAFWSALANRQGWLNLLAYTTNIANAIIAEGKIPILKAFIWMQGESDISESFANNYEWRLQGCFDSFQTHWNNILTTHSLASQTYKWVVGRIKLVEGTFSSVVRTAQANFCAVPGNNAVLIDTDGYPLRDPSHYSATGQIMFGLDIKNAID